MLFASTSLAARIERAECRLLTAAAEAASRRRPGADVFLRSIAGGIATFTAESSPFNKVAGLGFAGPLDEGELDEVERTFAARGARVQVEVSCLAEPSIAPMLSRRGYTLEGFENVLGRALSIAGATGETSATSATGATGATSEDAAVTSRSAPGEGFVIAVSGPDEFATWFDVNVTGFATPDTQGVVSHEAYPRDTLERDIGDMAASEGFVRYLARRDGTPAGAASMRVSDGIAQMCGAATLTAHRRRGIQSAFLAVRLADAGRAGCDVAVVTTQPGSKSQENAQRHGFALLYTRAVLVRGA